MITLLGTIVKALHIHDQLRGTQSVDRSLGSVCRNHPARRSQSVDRGATGVSGVYDVWTAELGRGKSHTVAPLT